VIRVGIASFAHLHADAYAAALGDAQGATLVGVWDAEPARGRDRAERYGAAWQPDFQALLDAVDAVVICSENVHHRDLALAAAGAGKHVLCEKPLATTLADARAMIAACADAGVTLQTAFPCPFSPAFARLVELVRGDAVGELLALCCTNRGRMPGGWFVDPALSGGGAVMDHTVHVADLLRRLLASEVVRVYAEAGQRLHHLGVDDSGLLTLDFADGRFATLDTSWSRPASFPTWGDVTIRAVGTRGTLAMDMFRQSLDRYADGHAQIGFGADLDRAMLQSFVDAVAGRGPVRATGEDGLRALEVALAAYRSIELGRPVALPLD
jgi:UDP-N-acetylglucosamine 3-dehydrogenase